MKLIAQVLFMLACMVTVAQAACPPDRPYNCVKDYNGKMRCGCGVT